MGLAAEVSSGGAGEVRAFSACTGFCLPLTLSLLAPDPLLSRQDPDMLQVTPPPARCVPPPVCAFRRKRATKAHARTRAYTQRVPLRPPRPAQRQQPAAARRYAPSRSDGVGGRCCRLVTSGSRSWSSAPTSRHGARARPARFATRPALFRAPTTRLSQPCARAVCINQVTLLSCAQLVRARSVFGCGELSPGRARWGQTHRCVVPLPRVRTCA